MAEVKQGTQVTMPQLGESVTEGTIAGWFKQIGDPVEKYEPLVEIVTDKVTAEVPSPVSGVLVEIARQEGDTVAVGTTICYVDEGNGASAAAPEPAAEPAAEPRPEPSSVAESESPEQSIDVQEAREARDEMALLRARSSPLVRRLAEEHDIDLSQLSGSGVGGRVTKADIEAYIQARGEVEAPPAPDVASVEEAPTAEAREPETAAPRPRAQIQLMPGDEIVEASLMRKQVAEHMVRSVQTAPHTTVWMEVDMSRVVRARERNKDEFQTREGFSLTFLPMVISVVVQALRDHPYINASWDDGRIILRKEINIGVAVALEDGLIVPVVKNADERTITGLARSINDLVIRARENRLSVEDVQGGTFTVNNPGALGSLYSTPIIVQPQAGILSMESVVRRPVVLDDDAIAIRPMMYLSLSVDHRILDGLAATRFLGDVKRRLEEFPEDVRI